VVPDWYGQWPLAEYPDYYRLARESTEELLLHGYVHRRERGWGPITLLTAGSDEMNGLDHEATRRVLERGQRVFSEVFGEPARGFIAPAWQQGHVRSCIGDSGSWRSTNSRDGVDDALGLEHVLGFFSLESGGCRKIPLATWSWDCGRWDGLGHVGNAFGRLLHSINRRVPSLAIHPRDPERGFWPDILRLIENLLEHGYEPTTPGQLLEHAYKLNSSPQLLETACEPRPSVQPLELAYNSSTPIGLTEPGCETSTTAQVTEPGCETSTTAQMTEPGCETGTTAVVRGPAYKPGRSVQVVEGGYRSSTSAGLLESH
jgi:peptidoglycan/xylan/chitin deacetylase (PgdA/CDA1 family)